MSSFDSWRVLKVAKWITRASYIVESTTIQFPTTAYTAFSI